MGSSAAGSRRAVRLAPLLIVVPLAVGLWIRALPADLPFSRDWAAGELGDAATASEIRDLSREVRDRYRDDAGRPYFLGFDSWFWYGEAARFAEDGRWGDAVVNGRPWDSLRNGGIGLPAPPNLFPWSLVVARATLSRFVPVSLESVAYWSGLVFTVGIVVLAFLVARHRGVVGALVAASVIAVHPMLVNRTTAGFCDTDGLLAVLTLGVCGAALAAVRFTGWRRAMWIGTAGALIGVFRVTHLSWWVVVDLLVAAFLLSIPWRQRGDAGRIRTWLPGLGSAAALLVAAWAFGALGLFVTWDLTVGTLRDTVLAPVRGPWEFLSLKAPAGATVWPNVYESVSELRSRSPAELVRLTGGPWVVAAGVLGLACAFRSKRRPGFDPWPVFLTLWFVASAAAAASAVRVLALFVLPLGLAIGELVETIWRWARRAPKTWCAAVRAVALLGALVGTGLLAREAWGLARARVPRVNDAWYETLRSLRSTPEDAIVTAWWDFGYPIETVGRRRATFDGGDHGRRLYWVARLFLESDENKAVGILRMLNATQDWAFHRLTVLLGDGPEQEYRALDLLEEVVGETRARAAEIYRAHLPPPAADEMLELTHPAHPRPQFVITAPEMVPVAPVWGSIGAWDFRAIRERGLDARPPHPEFLSGPAPLRRLGDGRLAAVHQIRGRAVTLTVDPAGRATLSGDRELELQSWVRATDDGVETRRLAGTAPLAVVIGPGGSDSVLCSPVLATSLFTRLHYLDGAGLSRFVKVDDRVDLRGGHIRTWRVEWEEPTSAR